MQLFILIMVNIFIGVALYLIISLKLERSATEFRQQRLRKEMDDMIKEFNQTADRNISLLEHKILVMKRLLERSGNMKSWDMLVGEDENSGSVDDHDEKSSPSSAREAEISPKPQSLNSDSSIRATASVKKSLPHFIRDVIDLFSNRKVVKPYVFADDKGNVNNERAFLKEQSDKLSHSIEVSSIAGHEKISIAKDLSGTALSGKSLNEKPEDISEEDNVSETGFNDDELKTLFSQTDDRYALIVRLFDEGCSMDQLSRFSGMPAGEIRLVLNLQKQ